jgi:STE24 endopeptidase
MPLPEFIPTIASALIAAQWAAAACLEKLNRNHARVGPEALPEAIRQSLPPDTLQKSIDYTLAKSRFTDFSGLADGAVLVALIWSGWLPLSWSWSQSHLGTHVWWQSLWLLGVGFALSIPSLPFEWWGQFRLEARFGFNTTSLGTWIADRLKGAGLALALGLPLLALILSLVSWAGPLWWVWAWAALLGFQLLVLFLAPVVIMPLFNKFTPLPDGPLRDRLLALGHRTGFNAQTIQVMDGSRRSRHANAFFTGFGKFRKIVLYDTLVAQLSEAELEAVLAHEIGHHRRKHIPQRLAWAALSSLIAFSLIGYLARDGALGIAFGFPSGNSAAPTLLLFALISPAVLFWSTPLGNVWSRKHEYEADAYARDAVGDPEPLIGALRKLSEKNLSNLNPHPWYSTFHYSHPTLVEREQALRNATAQR